MKIKKVISSILMIALAATTLAACGGNSGSNSSASEGSQTSGTAAESKSDFDTSKAISVVSRESGSGTRGAFIELFGIEEKDADGNKTDKTTEEAIIAAQTNVMMTTVAGDPAAIGYASLGSLNDTVKSVKIDGVDATAENIKNGTYKISRPFNIATKGEATGLAKDFIDFILSKEGQEVVSGDYIQVDENAKAYSGTKPEGTLVVAGSSSVSPVMEKLKEAYEKLNTNAKITIQTSDSSTGMQKAMDGTCDIGMASRDLKDSEKEVLTDIAIAIDGVAVIANPANPLESLTSEQVKSIFTGETTLWSDVIK